MVCLLIHKTSGTASAKSDQFKLMLLKKVLSNLKTFRKEKDNFLNLGTTPLFFKGCKLENVTATEISLSIED